MKDGAMIRQQRRIALSLVFLLFSGPFVLAVAQAPSTEVPIQVYADATGRKDVPVALDASMLAASIDGKPAQIVSARPIKDDKLLFALMVDISSSEAAQQKATKEAAVKIFQALTNERSQGYLVLFNFQTYPSKRLLQPSEVQAILDHAGFTGGTSLYDSVAQTASSILSKAANPDTPRRLIIVLTDGKDNYSRMTLDMMEKSVQREGAQIFSLSQDANDMSSKMSDFLLSDFTRKTGGRGIIAETMPDGVPALIAAVHGQIELTVIPSQTASSGLHSFTVKTTEKGVSIAVPDHIYIP